MRRGSLLLVLSVALLGVAWVLWPANPPIYDGLPLNTPPYQYRSPPAGLSPTPGPTSVSDVVRVSQTPYGFAVHTDEVDPQATVVIPVRSLVLPAHTDRLRIDIAPVALPARLPTGRLDGNVYRISVTNLHTGTAVALRHGATFSVTLRHTGASGRPFVTEYGGGSWHTLPSVEPAAGQSQASPSTFGDVALGLQPYGGGGLGPGVLSAIVVAALFGVLGAALFVIRRRSRI